MAYAIATGDFEHILEIDPEIATVGDEDSKGPHIRNHVRDLCLQRGRQKQEQRPLSCTERGEWAHCPA